MGEILKKLKEFFRLNINDELGNVSIFDWILSHRFMLLLILALISIFLILLVINVRNVNELLAERRELQKKIKILKDNNSRIHSHIIELQSAERIIPFAEKNLNMYLPQDAPKILRDRNEDQ